MNKKSVVLLLCLLIPALALLIYNFKIKSEEAVVEQPLKTDKQKVAAKETGTIKIGVVGAHTGDLAPFGIPTLRAVQYVAKEVNREGGIFGKQIELVIEDDRCKGETAYEAAKSLVRKNVSVVIGHTCSGATKKALEYYKEHKIIVISPSATNPELTQSGNFPSFFRTIAPDDAQAKLDVDFIIDFLKKTKVAILHDNDDYGRGFALFVKEYLEKRIPDGVTHMEEIEAGADGYSEALDRVKKSGAEVLLYGGYHPEASKLVLGMRRQKMNTIFISDDGVKDAAFLEIAGEGAEGIYVSGPKDTSKKEMAVAAISAHQKEYGEEPGAFYLNACAAMQALVNAIRKSGSLNHDSIKKFLRIAFVRTPLGTIRFDSRGDASGIGFSVYHVKDGGFHEIKFRKK